jgi:hypothetical protein
MPTWNLEGHGIPKILFMIVSVGIFASVASMLYEMRWAVSSHLFLLPSNSSIKTPNHRKETHPPRNAVAMLYAAC